MECFPLLDMVFKSATILIAIINLVVVIRFFSLKNKREDKDKERDRRINWLKTLILDHNLKSFYSFFDSIESELDILRSIKLSDNEKMDIEAKLGDQFISLRRRFSDILIAVDNGLYQEVLNICDELQKQLIDIIFDQGVNLSHPPKYQELILAKLTISKTEIIRKLFAYRGD